MEGPREDLKRAGEDRIRERFGTAPGPRKFRFGGGSAWVDVGRRFVALAEEAGIPPIQLAMLWVKEQRGVTAPIVGPRTVAHLEDYLPVGDMRLSDEVRRACDALVPPGTVVTSFHNSAGWGAGSRTLGVADRG